MRRFVRLALCVVLVTAVTAVVPAAPRVETNPDKDYPCTPDAGPYVICVYSFSGPDADNLARQLALQIRQRDNLPAYVFNFSDQQRKQIEAEWANLGKINPDGSPRKLNFNIPEERAVFIGGFADMPAACAALKDVKKLAAPQLHLAGKTPLPLLYDYEPRPDGRVEVKAAEMNPFPTSFVAPNPTVPRQQQVKKADPFLKKLNEDESYSLFNNPKTWTLAVKEYACDTMILPHATATEPSILDKLFSSKKGGEMVEKTGMQAHELAKLLRTPASDKMPYFGFDAYVLHTRHSSIVTVGAFTGPNDPEMQKMAERILKLKLQAHAPQGQSIDFIAAPMEIPRPE